MSEFLKDQVALVTGGAQGIGWAIALALADHGAQVHVCDISEAQLAKAAAEAAVSRWANQLHFAVCDVSDKEAVAAWVKDVYGQNGRLDILVNNAVYVRWERAQELSLDDVERMMQVGYLGMVHAIQAVLPLMQQAGRGYLINMGSSAGRLYITPTMGGYCAMKAAVDAYVQILQMELADSPIHVMLVRPAAVAGTNFFRQQVSSTRMPRLGDIVPYITPPHVAKAVVQGLRRRRAVVNVPGYLGGLFTLFALAPRFVRWFMGLGGNGRLDYGEVSWQYRPRR
jgi:NAD(P)-dependent dehydrogenase (short-subunit alcohol dehydrogenase family)